MKNSFFIFASAYALSLFALVAIIILPENKYSWMHDFDSQMKMLPADDGLGGRLISIWIIFATSVVPHGVIVIKKLKFYKLDYKLSLLLLILPLPLILSKY